jgi:hypothetical protein
MNLKLLWRAWIFMVVVCGILFTAGLVAQRPSLTDAAFDPLVAALSYLAGVGVISLGEQGTHRGFSVN